MYHLKQTVFIPSDGTFLFLSSLSLSLSLTMHFCFHFSCKCFHWSVLKCDTKSTKVVLYTSYHRSLNMTEAWLQFLSNFTLQIYRFTMLKVRYFHLSVKMSLLVVKLLERYKAHNFLLSKQDSCHVFVYIEV